MSTTVKLFDLPFLTLAEVDTLRSNRIPVEVKQRQCYDEYRIQDCQVEVEGMTLEHLQNLSRVFKIEMKDTVVQIFAI